MLTSISEPNAPVQRILVLYDADCGFCQACASLLARLDGHARLQLLAIGNGDEIPGAPAGDRLLETMHARDATGRWLAGSEAWLRIADELPALRPLAAWARLPFVRPFLGPGYRLIAANRQRISRLLGLDARACRRSER
jgi:predicted DCC family thiol-disulfide oxidoreductase YuxK